MRAALFAISLLLFSLGAQYSISEQSYCVSGDCEKDTTKDLLIESSMQRSVLSVSGYFELSNESVLFDSSYECDGRSEFRRVSFVPDGFLKIDAELKSSKIDFFLRVFKDGIGKKDDCYSFSEYKKKWFMSRFGGDVFDGSSFFVECYEFYSATCDDAFFLTKSRYLRPEGSRNVIFPIFENVKYVLFFFSVPEDEATLIGFEDVDIYYYKDYELLLHDSRTPPWGSGGGF